MSFTEYVMKAGSWDLTLKEGTPRHILRQIDVRDAAFRQIVILPGRISLETLDDPTILGLARYVGIYRVQERNGLRMNGAGLPILLGDEDGKGDIMEATRSTVNGWLSQWYSNLLPGGFITGSFLSPGGSYPASFRLINFREAWDKLADYFDVEWRIRNTLHFDVGPVDFLYGSQTRLLVVGKDSGISPGRDFFMNVVGGGTDLGVDMEDYTSKVVYLTGDQDNPTFTTAGNDSTLYSRPTGHPLIMDRKIEAWNDPTPNSNIMAAVQLGRFNKPRIYWSVEGGTYDIGRDCPVGSRMYLYDPTNGLMDVTNEKLNIRGTEIYPVQTRLMGLTTPIKPGYGVYLRNPIADAGANYIDLSPYVEYETGTQKIEVGSIPRTSR